MEHYSFKHVNFTYPEGEKKILRDLSFSIARGEFVVFCGPSGCGKTTLLRHLKPSLTPHGCFAGEIRYDGKLLAELSQQEQAQQIGFVLQSPENQVVTDKVWHELAFGLESLGYDTPTIRRRVAEIAAFFGIEHWFYKNITELSGGQKQLLSLASVMAMQPQVLVLDEPTAQLDPIAAGEFLALLGKINRELGTTVILTEHRLEETFPFATRVIVMDEGAILCDGQPRQVGLQLRDKGSGMFLAMPAAMRVWASVDTALDCPITVRDGSEFLTRRAQEQPLLPLTEQPVLSVEPEVTLSCEDVWFRYEKNGSDVVKGLSLQLHRGEFYALLGGNGAGKSTALKVLSGLRTAYRGTVQRQGKLGHLPQNPQTLFLRRTVREDLYEVYDGTNTPREMQDAEVARMAELCGLQAFWDHHPYDISGGEQQRAALAKVLLTRPDILLLDEPTKGFDAQFKVTFARILQRLTAQGITVLMVSHDVDFCAAHAHRCGLFFDGSIVTEGAPREFFSGNSFYTTSANRMARHLIARAVTVGDIIGCCGGELPKEPEEPEAAERAVVPAQKQAADAKVRSLPVWRKVLAGLSLAVAVAVYFYAAGIVDLPALPEGAMVQPKWLYSVVIVALIVLIAAVGRRRAPLAALSAPVPRRKLSRRTLVAAVLVALCVPLTIFVGIALLGNRHYRLTAILVLVECMAPFFMMFERRKPKARELVIIAVLCALGVAGRSAFFMLPQFKPVLALVILSGVAFGGETGFLVGAVTMLVSNMLFSQGPWTPWQMFAMGIIGFLSGVLFGGRRLGRSRAVLAVFGAFAAVVIYGGILNPTSLLMYSAQTINREMLLACYASGLPMDLVHGAATALFLLLAAEPMLEKLERVKVKYGLVDEA